MLREDVQLQRRQGGSEVMVLAHRFRQLLEAKADELRAVARAVRASETGSEVSLTPVRTWGPTWVSEPETLGVSLDQLGVSGSGIRMLQVQAWRVMQRLHAFVVGMSVVPRVCALVMCRPFAAVRAARASD